MSACNTDELTAVAEMLARVILPKKTDGEDGWLAWVRQMQEKAREALRPRPRRCDVASERELSDAATMLLTKMVDLSPMPDGKDEVELAAAALLKAEQKSIIPVAVSYAVRFALADVGPGERWTKGGAK